MFVYVYKYCMHYTSQNKHVLYRIPIKCIYICLFRAVNKSANLAERKSRCLCFVSTWCMSDLRFRRVTSWRVWQDTLTELSRWHVRPRASSAPLPSTAPSRCGSPTWRPLMRALDMMLKLHLWLAHQGAHGPCLPVGVLSLLSTSLVVH